LLALLLAAALAPRELLAAGERAPRSADGH